MTALRRVAVAVLVVLVPIAVVAVAVRLVWDAAGRHGTVTQCSAGGYELTPDQAVVAASMTGVVIQRNLPDRAAVLVLAAGLQETKLRNLPSGSGDRDSVGVLQQRPSQGWGTEEQLADVHYATGAFLDAVQKVPNWQTGELTKVVQAVQISAVPEGYARWEGEAQALADAFLGRKPAGLSCTYPTPDHVATPADVSTALVGDLPVRTPVLGPTTVTVPGAGWPTAAWFVANGQRLGLETVSYAGQTWNRAKGWSADSKASAGAVVATVHT